VKPTEVLSAATTLIGREVAVTYKLVGTGGFSHNPVTVIGLLLAVGSKVEMRGSNPRCLVIDATPTDARPVRTGGVPIVAIRSVTRLVLAAGETLGTGA
jgi:hypothetical protein